MGWSIGYDTTWRRDIGYGVPAYCDHPSCNAEIDRGLSHVCGDEPYGGEHGCGLYFCSAHLAYYTENRSQACPRCGRYKPPYKAKPDHPTWIRHKLIDASWHAWRTENREAVIAMRAALRAKGLRRRDVWLPRAKGSPAGASVPAVDPSRSTPNALTP